MGVLDRFRLTGKRALTTGASRGLGRSMSLALAEAGADTVLIARDPSRLEQTAAEVRERGRRAWTYAADIADPTACEESCHQVLREVGDIDILVNNVGARSVDIATEEETLAQWQAAMDRNLTHCFLCTKLIGGAMLTRGTAGRIINVASISAMIANRGVGGRHYEAAKAAVLHFTRACAADWAAKGVTVNAICPGLFMTEPNQQWAEKLPDVIAGFVENIPMGRPGDPDEIGPLVVYLASDASAYVTGAAFVIDGGYTLW